MHNTQNICQILESQLKSLKIGENDIETEKRMYCMLAYSCLWGALGSVISQSYGAAEAAMKEAFDDLQFPRGETIFDFYINDDTQKGFLAWGQKVPEFAYDK